MAWSWDWLESEVMGDSIILTTHLGEGQAEIVERAHGSGRGTKWRVSLPWGEYIFWGGKKALLADVSKRDRGEAAGERTDPLRFCGLQTRQGGK
jgi:hypothetical protein